MKLGKAYSIFTQIGRDDVTDEEKGEAILIVADMPTHNGITKDNMLAVIKYLLPLAFDVHSDRCRHEINCGFDVCNLEECEHYNPWDGVWTDDQIEQARRNRRANDG